MNSPKKKSASIPAGCFEIESVFHCFGSFEIQAERMTSAILTSGSKEPEKT